MILLLTLSLHKQNAEQSYKHEYCSEDNLQLSASEQVGSKAGSLYLKKTFMTQLCFCFCIFLLLIYEDKFPLTDTVSLPSFSGKRHQRQKPVKFSYYQINCTLEPDRGALKVGDLHSGGDKSL